MSTAEEVLDQLDETRQRWWLFSMLCNIILATVASLTLLALFVLVDVIFQISPAGLTVLLSLWLLTTIVIAARTIYGIVKYELGLAGAAREVEMSCPELGSDMINLVQLLDAKDDSSSDFRRAAIDASVKRIANVSFRSTSTELSRWWRWRLRLQMPRDLGEFGLTLAGLLLVMLLLSMAFPTWASSLKRLFTPGRFVPQVGQIQILEVVPGSTEILVGSRLDITARIANPNAGECSATLYVDAGDGDETTHEMYVSQTGDTFSFSFPAVLNDMQYRMQIGDSQTDIYTVSVVKKPTIVDLQIAYEFPPYLDRPVVTVQQQHGDLEAPLFSVAHLELHSSSSLMRGYAQLEDKTIYGRVDESNDRVLSLRIPMTKQGSYTIHLFDKSGHTDAEPRVNSIRTLPDAAPVVELVKPGRESSLGIGSDVLIIVRATDDHGLGEVRLETKIEESNDSQSPHELHTIRSWDGLASAATLSYTLLIDPVHHQAGQTVLVRAVALDRRRFVGSGIRLVPQQTVSAWHRIQLIQRDVALANKMKQRENTQAKLWAILQLQVRARLSAARSLRPQDIDGGWSLIKDVRQKQIRVRMDASTLAQSINSEDDDQALVLKQVLGKLARGEMMRAVQQAEAAARPDTRRSFAERVQPLMETQDRIIDVLRGLLEQARRDISKMLTEMKEREGGDLPPDVAEKLRELRDKLQEFTKHQKRVIEASENLAKKPVEDFTEEEEKLLRELASIEDDWSRFMEETHSDFSKLPEQDFSNPSMLEELIEVQTELKMAKDALTKKSADIAVPLEQLGAEMAEELVTNIEKWLPDTPDRERWSQEEPLTDEMKEAPMAELPGELEDLVGELMEEEESLFDEMEDVSSSWADSLDKGAGWDAADGPISNMSAKGVTGNRLPNTSEIGGRSGEGRQGKSSGEFVGDTAVGKGGRKTPSRLNPDPFVKGQVKDFSKDPTGGATGGGKESGVGGEGLEGPVPTNPQRSLQRMANRQADLRNKAESIDVKFAVLNYHHTDLKHLIAAMSAVEEDLRSGRYQSALRRRKVLLEGLGNIKNYLGGEFKIRRDRTSSLPADIQKELLGSMQESSPTGWEKLNRQYFERLGSEESVPQENQSSAGDATIKQSAGAPGN